MTTKTGGGAKPLKSPPGGRDATRQGVEPPGKPPTDQRNYEDAQDAAFDPRGDRTDDKPAGNGQ